MRVNPLVFLVGLAFALSLADAVGAAKIFKWVDEKGVTHYGESIPPEYKDGGSAEMSKQGVTLRKVAPAATMDQRKAAEEKSIRDREEKQRTFEQRRRDLALMNTYTSAKEIEEHRDRTLQMPLQVIKGLEPRLKKAQEKLAAVQQQAASAGKGGKPVPDGMEQDIADHKAEVDALKADIERNQAQIEAIKAKFDADKKRYIELTQR
jgi:hypothetical protein